MRVARDLSSYDLKIIDKILVEDVGWDQMGEYGNMKRRSLNSVLYVYTIVQLSTITVYSSSSILNRTYLLNHHELVNLSVQRSSRSRFRDLLMIQGNMSLDDTLTSMI